MVAEADNSTREYSTLGVEATDRNRIKDVALESGEVIVYDTDVEDAWIQSESAIGLERMI